MARFKEIWCAIIALTFFTVWGVAQNASLIAHHLEKVHYDGNNWNLKGDGIVCCPCTIPCPCRSNAAPSYGHCEATLYLRIQQGRYGNVNLQGVQVIETPGMCAISNRGLYALYLDSSSSASQRASVLKLIASFAPHRVVSFPYIRTITINARVIANRLFKISVPGILEIVVDRNWGQARPPMPEVAAPDFFSNVIQYPQNIRYFIHDKQAGLNFDYSNRQANYRKVNLSVQDYRSQSILIQFEDGTGWFNARQMALIKLQHLSVPRLKEIQKDAERLREGSNH